MTWAQTITALSTALACADDPAAVADALRDEAAAKRIAHAGYAVVQRIQALEHEIRRRLAGEAQTIYFAPDVLELLEA